MIDHHSHQRLNTSAFSPHQPQYYHHGHDDDADDAMTGSATTSTYDNDDKIRSRLLNTLGFHHRQHPHNHHQHHAFPQNHHDFHHVVKPISMLQHEGPRRRMSLNDSALERERQREDKEHEFDTTDADYSYDHLFRNLDHQYNGYNVTLVKNSYDTATGSTRSNYQRHRKKNRVVRFNTDVMVQPIASHRQFSKRIKQTLWTSPTELQDMAYRNHLEYTAEGYDPSKVLEDDDMYIDATTFEKVHPYWIEQHYYREQKQQQPYNVDDDDESSSQQYDNFDNDIAIIIDPMNIIDDDSN